MNPIAFVLLPITHVYFKSLHFLPHISQIDSGGQFDDAEEQTEVTPNTEGKLNHFHIQRNRK